MRRRQKQTNKDTESNKWTNKNTDTPKARETNKQTNKHRQQLRRERGIQTGRQ